jgi:DNA-binding NtrC family response regulator
MQALHEEAERAAESDISILLLGETGVGKEVLARRIHAASKRASGPFVAINCAALSETLLESELFGHTRGAFTGALRDQPGVFESAEGGTLFLDEIGELPLATQVKLLRVLEDRCVSRVGSRELRRINTRFITATNRDLSKEVESGRFRKDLFFRINSVTLNIPTLNERPSEILPLASLFLERAKGADNALELSADAARHLEAHDWPGNVRELRNAIEYSVAMSRGPEILVEDLQAQLRTTKRGSAPTSLSRLQAEMHELERQRIADALASCSGNQTKAAALLGFSRRTLVSRLDDYGFPRPRKKAS